MQDVRRRPREQMFPLGPSERGDGGFLVPQVYHEHLPRRAAAGVESEGGEGGGQGAGGRAGGPRGEGRRPGRWPGRRPGWAWGARPRRQGRSALEELGCWRSTGCCSAGRPGKERISSSDSSPNPCHRVRDSRLGGVGRIIVLQCIRLDRRPDSGSDCVFVHFMHTM